MIHDGWSLGIQGGYPLGWWPSPGHKRSFEPAPARASPWLSRARPGIASPRDGFDVNGTCDFKMDGWMGGLIDSLIIRLVCLVAVAVVIRPCYVDCYCNFRNDIQDSSPGGSPRTRHALHIRAVPRPGTAPTGPWRYCCRSSWRRAV